MNWRVENYKGLPVLVSSSVALVNNRLLIIGGGNGGLQEPSMLLSTGVLAGISSASSASATSGFSTTAGPMSGPNAVQPVQPPTTTQTKTSSTTNTNSNNTLKWSEYMPSIGKLNGCAGAATCIDPTTQKIYVFGGFYQKHRSSLSISDKFNCIDIATESITTIKRSKAPIARSGATLVYYSKSLYLFGGLSISKGSESTLGDFWEYNIDQEEWSEIIKGKAPYTRESHSAVTIDSKMIVYGGLSLYNNRPMKRDDIAIYDFNMRSWSFPASFQSSDLKPPARFMHVAVSYGRNMFVIGGHIDSHREQAVHVFNVETSRWMEVETWGGPVTRAGCCAAVVGSEVVVFGGVDASANANVNVDEGGEGWRLDLKGLGERRWERERNKEWGGERNERAEWNNNRNDIEMRSNEWGEQRNNDWNNDRSDQRVNERLDRSDQRVNERLDQRNNDWSDQRNNERSDQRVNDRSEQRVNDRSNDRNEQRNNDWNNERSEQRVSDRNNDRIDQRNNDRSDQRNNERLEQRSNERPDQRSNDRLDQRNNDRSDQWRNDRNDQWKNDRNDQWKNDRIDPKKNNFDQRTDRNDRSNQSGYDSWNDQRNTAYEGRNARNARVEPTPGPGPLNYKNFTANSMKIEWPNPTQALHTLNIKLDQGVTKWVEVYKGTGTSCIFEYEQFVPNSECYHSFSLGMIDMVKKAAGKVKRLQTGFVATEPTVFDVAIGSGEVRISTSFRREIIQVRYKGKDGEMDPWVKISSAPISNLTVVGVRALPRIAGHHVSVQFQLDGILGPISSDWFDINLFEGPAVEKNVADLAVGEEVEEEVVGEGVAPVGEISVGVIKSSPDSSMLVDHVELSNTGSMLAANAEVVHEGVDVEMSAEIKNDGDVFRSSAVEGGDSSAAEFLESSTGEIFESNTVDGLESSAIAGLESSAVDGLESSAVDGLESSFVEGISESNAVEGLESYADIAESVADVNEDIVMVVEDVAVEEEAAAVVDTYRVTDEITMETFFTESSYVENTASLIDPVMPKIIIPRKSSLQSESTSPSRPPYSPLDNNSPPSFIIPTKSSKVTIDRNSHTKPSKDESAAVSLEDKKVKLERGTLSASNSVESLAASVDSAYRPKGMLERRKKEEERALPASVPLISSMEQTLPEVAKRKLGRARKGATPVSGAKRQKLEVDESIPLPLLDEPVKEELLGSPTSDYGEKKKKKSPKKAVKKKKPILKKASEPKPLSEPMQESSEADWILPGVYDIPHDMINNPASAFYYRLTYTQIFLVFIDNEFAIARALYYTPTKRGTWGLRYVVNKYSQLCYVSTLDLSLQEDLDMIREYGDDFVKPKSERPLMTKKQLRSRIPEIGFGDVEQPELGKVFIFDASNLISSPVS